MRWEDKQEVKKGDMGENFLDQYLFQTGKWIPYLPVFDGPHPFDRIAASLDKKELFIVEVKTKPRRKWYPDTGFNYKNYLEYKHLNEKYGIRVFVVFVDEYRGEGYGNFLDCLEIEVEIILGSKRIKYPLIDDSKYGCKIIYFPLSNMIIPLFKLTPQQCQKLKKLSKYSQDYSEPDTLTIKELRDNVAVFAKKHCCTLETKQKPLPKRTVVLVSGKLE